MKRDIYSLRNEARHSVLFVAQSTQLTRVYGDGKYTTVIDPKPHHELLHCEGEINK